MATDWKLARELDEFAQGRPLPMYAREAMRRAAQLIRDLDEELDVRNQLIDRVVAGLPWPQPGSAELVAMREDYRRRLNEAIARRVD